jgi:hypothetical protein
MYRYILVIVGVLPLLATAVPLDKLLSKSTSMIHAIAYDKTCVGPSSTSSSELHNDVPVTLQWCQSGRYGKAQAWEMPTSGSSGQIRMNDFCLDAGIDPHDGGKVKLWECIDGVDVLQQMWKVNGDGTLETANGQCLNVRKESEGDEKEMQTWACNGEDPQNCEYSSGIHRMLPIKNGRCALRSADVQCSRSSNRSEPPTRCSRM